MALGFVTNPAPVKRSVEPSLVDLAAASVPMLPLAPLRFSMTNGLPRLSESFCARMRPAASTPRPREKAG